MIGFISFFKSSLGTILRDSKNKSKQTNKKYQYDPNCFSTISLFSLIVNICQILLNCNQKRVQHEGAGSIKSVLWSAHIGARDREAEVQTVSFWLAELKQLILEAKMK